MLVHLKGLIKKNDIVGAYLNKRRFSNWRKAGSPFPPPHEFKQLALLYYASISNLDVLIETGTYFGDTIHIQKDFFQRIVSIELSPELHERARRRFRRARNVEVLQGDSAVVLGKVVEELDRPALFWLDGHYSGGITARGEKVSPIFEELRPIFESEYTHTVLIDDARLFDGTDGYPTTHELEAFVATNSDYLMSLAQDIFVLRKSAERDF